MTDLSPQNRKVLALLQAADKPLSAYDILAKLRRHGLRSPPTIYRALEQLMRCGLAHRLESLNAFVACQQHDGAHDHAGSFAICTQCGAVQEIEDPALLKTIKKLGAKFLAQMNKGVFELSGTCHACVGKRK